MKLAIIVILATVGASMACESKKTREEFEAFRRQYRKNYENEAEEDYRCSVYAANAAKIEEHNMRQARGLEEFTMAINKYSDYTHEEFIQKFTGLKPEFEQKTRIDFTKKQVREYNPAIKAPASVNWVEQGFVTPVKNQGQCGSCYTFATMGVTESRYMIKNNQPYTAKDNQDLSEQHPLECSTEYGNQKCMGGLMTNTYRFMIQENQGAQHEEQYPYISADGNNGTKCHYTEANAAFRITGFTEVARDDKALEQAVSEGPVAVGIKVVDSFQAYSSGIYCKKALIYAECGSGSLVLGLNHAVVVVGYTKDYWLVKNSWGEQWGEGGYIRMCRSMDNMCGVNMMASYPHV